MNSAVKCWFPTAPLTGPSAGFSALFCIPARSRQSKALAWAAVLALAFPAIVGGLTDLGLRPHVFHLAAALSGAAGFRGDVSLTPVVCVTRKTAGVKEQWLEMSYMFHFVSKDFKTAIILIYGVITSYVHV